VGVVIAGSKISQTRSRRLCSSGSAVMVPPTGRSVEPGQPVGVGRHDRAHGPVRDQRFRTGDPLLHDAVAVVVDTDRDQHLESLGEERLLPLADPLDGIQIVLVAGLLESEQSGGVLQVGLQLTDLDDEGQLPQADHEVEKTGQEDGGECPLGDPGGYLGELRDTRRQADEHDRDVQGAPEQGVRDRRSLRHRPNDVETFVTDKSS
jgi:hypothetical protein